MTVRFGIRLHTISRDSSTEAWATADRLLDDLDPETVAAAQQALGSSESVGQQRMLALHGGSRDKLEISPNLWAGVGLVRGGAGTALVGSHAEVADRIEEYHALGIEHFVLSGYPHLEEAYWFGEGVRRSSPPVGCWMRGPLRWTACRPPMADRRPHRAGHRCWSPAAAERDRAVRPAVVAAGRDPWGAPGRRCRRASSVGRAVPSAGDESWLLPASGSAGRGGRAVRRACLHPAAASRRTAAPRVPCASRKPAAPPGRDPALPELGET